MDSYLDRNLNIAMLGVHLYYSNLELHYFDGTQFIGRCTAQYFRQTLEPNYITKCLKIGHDRRFRKYYN